MSQQSEVLAKLQGMLATPPPYPFNAILLAAADEKALAFVNQYKDTIDALTGGVCRLFYFEAPVPSEKTYRLAEPIVAKPGAAYPLAQEMKIPYEKLPCMVVFERLSDDLSNVAIVSMPEDAIIRTFQVVLDDMNACKGSPDGQRVHCFKNRTRVRLIKATAKGILATVLNEGLKDVIGAGVKAITTK